MKSEVLQLKTVQMNSHILRRPNDTHIDNIHIQNQ